MQTKEYHPDWRSAQEIAEWLGVTVNTLFKWRTSKGLNWSNLEGKTVMYDKKQINELLNKNSTYAVLNEKRLTAVELSENFYT